MGKGIKELIFSVETHLMLLSSIWNPFLQPCLESRVQSLSGSVSPENKPLSFLYGRGGEISSPHCGEGGMRV